MLMHVPGVLDRDQVAAMRKALEAADWVDGRQTVGPQGAQVKRNLQLAEASPLRRQLGEQVLAALGRHPLYFASVLPRRTHPPRFNLYRGGGQYGFHVDGSVVSLRPTPSHAQATRRSALARTLYLPEPSA